MCRYQNCARIGLEAPVRKFTFLLTVIVLLANAGWVAQTHAQWHSPTLKDPRWSVEFSGKAYDRPGTELGIPLITDIPTGATLFDSNQATDLGAGGGAEVKFNWVTRNDREMEFRTILSNWEQSHLIEGPNMASPFFPVGAPAPTTVNYDYESNYFSFELMCRHAIKPGITGMFGPRIVSTSDQVSFAGTLLVDPGGGAPVVPVTQTTVTEATNILLGLQGGFEFNVPLSQNVYINSFVRAGGYTNPTSVTSSQFDNLSPFVTSDKQTKSTGSFLGEIGVRMYADIVPNKCSTFVGYEATWIDGIALAPPQLLAAPGAGVETANTPFFNAAVFGLQFGY